MILRVAYGTNDGSNDSVYSLDNYSYQPDSNEWGFSATHRSWTTTCPSGCYVEELL